MNRLGTCVATVLAALLAAMVSTMAAAGASEGTVGLVTLPESPPPVALIERGASDAATEASVPYVSHDLAGATEEEWADEVATLAGTVAALIIDTPFEVPLVAERAHELGVPVVATVRGDDAALYDVLVRMDDAEAGRRAADVMSAAIERRRSAANVVVTIDCPPEGPDVASRVAAFTEAVDATGFEVVAIRSEASDPSEAATLLGGVLEDMGAVAGVLACNAPIALGALEAIAAAGLDPASDVTTIAFGWDPPLLQAVADGRIAASLAQDFPGIGATAMRVASELAQGSMPVLDDPERRIRFVPYVLVSAENVEEFQARVDLSAAAD
jgi:ribose transport system substrate-binding protein